MHMHGFLVHIWDIRREGDIFGVNQLLYFVLESFAILNCVYGCLGVEFTSYPEGRGVGGSFRSLKYINEHWRK